MTTTTSLPLDCRLNGCTVDDCCCWEREDEALDTTLVAEAFGTVDDVDPRSFTIVYIDDARMLSILWPTSGDARRRLYLNETTGEITDVPLRFDSADDAHDWVSGADYQDEPAP